MDETGANKIEHSNNDIDNINTLKTLSPNDVDQLNNDKNFLDGTNNRLKRDNINTVISFLKANETSGNDSYTNLSMTKLLKGVTEQDVCNILTQKAFEDNEDNDQPYNEKESAFIKKTIENYNNYMKEISDERQRLNEETSTQYPPFNNKIPTFITDAYTTTIEKYANQEYQQVINSEKTLAEVIGKNTRQVCLDDLEKDKRKDTEKTIAEVIQKSSVFSNLRQYLNS